MLRRIEDEDVAVDERLPPLDVASCAIGARCEHRGEPAFVFDGAGLLRRTAVRALGKVMDLSSIASQYLSIQLASSKSAISAGSAGTIRRRPAMTPRARSALAHCSRPGAAGADAPAALRRAARRRALRTALRRGAVAVDARAGADLGVSRNTVMAAFEQLLAEGYLEGRVGAGTFVTPRPAGRVSVRAPCRAPRRAAPERPRLSRGRALLVDAR